LVGNIIRSDSKKEGFTMDIFIGLGVGYRDIHNSWQGHSEYDNLYFKDVKSHFYSIPFRLGINVGYIFKSQRGKKK